MKSSLAVALVILGAALQAQPGSGTIVWTLDRLDRIGGHASTITGSPLVVATDLGPAVEFDGVDDGLFLDANPLAGLSRFTIEVQFQPAPDGPEEQRFLHFQERDTENRALVELRLKNGTWALDTYLRSGEAQLPLLDQNKRHPAARWHVAALVYDGETMSSFVDGVAEPSGRVRFAPLTAGRTSIGVRQNKVSWFKGRIRQIRISPRALEPAALLRAPLMAAATEVIPLWPEGVPGAKQAAGDERLEEGRVSNVQVPTLTRIAPLGQANGTAVIVCPGGGYARLAMSNEGAGLASVLQARGVTAFVLKYRLAEYGHPAPLQDVLRAIRLVRSRAAEWGLRPDRIGIVGASAGGHLAASAATMFDDAEGRIGAAIDAVSARPDFAALLYPVITMKGALAHAGSRENLLGKSPAAALVDRLSVESRVSARTPPVFLVHTTEDRTVPYGNSVLFHESLQRVGVPSELHLYDRGAHGFGTTPGLGTTSAWVERWMDWMRAGGWLPAAEQPRDATWARGIEGQRKADLGDGTFLNPIMAGDHPDPSILKDGADYYMTFSSFDAYPGLALWHSRDLVNWQPVTATLRRNVGSVWAPDLVKHGGRYFIYFPARTATYRSNYVIWADNIRGPWSDPIDLKVGNIDPGHAVEADGRRYLFLSAGMWVPLSADGLSVTGPMTKVYDGWKYPSDWIVESYSQEGPKILRRGAYFYQVLAEGGTAGPPTGHMIVAARARRLEGPWENSPYNPILRTASGSERWWSKGHGTLVEGPGGQWYVVYHAYENGFYTLGRQTLLEPIEWTSDGWFRATGVDVARPIPRPRGEAVPHGAALSDDFSTNKMGTQWSFYNGTEADQQRVQYQNGSLVLSARGSNPTDSAPLWFVAGDHAYEIEVSVEASAGATAGVLLFYSRRLYAGLGVSASNFILHRYGTERPMAKPSNVGQAYRLRLRNDRHIVTIDYSTDGKTWERFGTGMEVSGYHHNVAGDFLSLRPAIYAAGSGVVRFRDFRYRALP
jgi:beta-xylosidase/acetyl esterase/lipase